jgi:hypothetical protein
MRDVTYSAYVANNAAVLDRVLALYTTPGSCVLDLTYSKGRFWNGPHRDRYILHSAP